LTRISHVLCINTNTTIKMTVIQTQLTDLLHIQHPILLAGMNVAAGAELAAAVTNAGGMGVIGGLGYTPEQLRAEIHEMKTYMKDPRAPFGIDYPIPFVGGNARKTNYDYSKGRLNELIGVVIQEKAALFVCAIGIPPPNVVKKLHDANILIMNMVGHPKHVSKALEAGVDLICPQGGEGGGHTGDIPSSILIPACVDAVRGHRSPLTGQPVLVVGAGGVLDGRSLAANLMWGASGVWVGTRFVASTEAAAPKRHKEMLVSAGVDDAVTTLIYSGRPLRLRRNEYVDDWNNNRQDEMKHLLSQGKIPHDHELEQHPEISASTRMWLMGSVAGLIHDIKPAQQIVDSMVAEAAALLDRGRRMVQVQAKL